MYRTTLRTVSRTVGTPISTLRAAPRRFAHTAVPADRYRSWKSSLARWGLAAGGIWYYTTSDVFADSPAYNSARLPVSDVEDENLPTVDAIAASRKSRRSAASTSSPSELSVPSTSSSPSSTQAVTATQATPLEAGRSESLEELDEEADQQGAYNEETGEINWDCPCLGGMAHGPCGPEFREAFSCFIYSKDEPKGIDCIDKFKGMQDCFRAHPDIYGAELSEDEDEQDQNDQVAAGAATSATPQDSASQPKSTPQNSASDPNSTSNSNSNSSSPPSEFQSDPAQHPDAPMPVAMHHDQPHSDSIPTAAFSATTEETSVGAPPGATFGEDQDAKRKRAEAAAEQVKKDYGGKEADQQKAGKGHRSESELKTGGEKGSKMSENKGRSS